MRSIPHPRSLGVLLVLVLLASCGSGSHSDDEGSPLTTYKGTQSPGDVWTYTLGGGTFTARNDTLGHDYGGDVTALTNGYLRLDVTSSTDPGIGPLPALAYALEIPDVAMLVLPAGPDPRVIICCAIGTTPTEEATYNYVKLPDPEWGLGTGGVDTEEAWGVGTTHISGASGEIFDIWSDRWAMRNDTDVPTESGWSPETYTAVDGWLVPDVGDQRVALTPSGVFIQDAGPNCGGTCGVEAPAADLGLGTLFTHSHDFLGYVFHYDDPDDDTQAVWARIDAGLETITGGTFTTAGAFDTAIPEPAGIRLTFTSEVRPGIFRGVQTEPGPDGVLGTADDEDRGDFVMLCSNIAGHWFIFGIIEPGPGDVKPTNFLVFEQ